MPRCGGLFEPRRKTAKFCSDRCRNEARDYGPKSPILSASATTLPDAVSTSLAVQNSSTISKAQSRYLDETENPSLSWVYVNDVTWKLTDGVILREPISGLLGSVSSPRALAWVTRDCETEAWPPDDVADAVASPHHVWFVRINTRFLGSIGHPAANGPDTYGPVTIGEARKAADHRLKFGVFPRKKPVHHLHWKQPHTQEGTASGDALKAIGRPETMLPRHGSSAQGRASLDPPQPTCQKSEPADSAP